MISEDVVTRDAGFKLGVAWVAAFSLLFFVPLCHAVTISTSDAFITQPIYPGTLPAPSTLPASDGSDGIFQPTQSAMLDLVPDAVFNFSTISIGSGITVGFNRYGSNEPIYFLATGDVLIDGSLDGGLGPLYIETPGSITIGGNLSAQDLTLWSDTQINILSGATLNGTTIALGSGNQTLTPGDPRIVLSDRSVSLVSVPLPPSLGLLLSGLVSLWPLRRRLTNYGIE